MKSIAILLLSTLSISLWLIPSAERIPVFTSTAFLNQQTDDILFSETQLNSYFEKKCFFQSIDSTKSALLKSLHETTTTEELQNTISQFNHSRLNQSNYNEEKINFDLFKNASFEVQKQLLEACILQAHAYWRNTIVKSCQIIFCGIPNSYLLESPQEDSLKYQLIEEVEKPTFSAEINGKWHPLLKQLSPDNRCTRIAFNSDTFNINP